MKKFKPNVVSSEHWKEVLNNASEYATSVLDAKGYVYRWGTVAKKLTGYSTKEIIGKHYSIFYTKEDIKRRLPQKILSRAARHGLCETEGLRVRKDGALYWASGMIVAIYDKNKKLRGYARFSRDATKEHQLKRQRDEFLGIAAHELKTPITTLNLYAQLLRERMLTTRDKENLAMLNDIEEQSNRLVKLVNDLLTVNAVEAGRLVLHEGEFDIGKLAAKVAARMSASSGMRIEVKYPRQFRVRGDIDRIEEVLINLLGNAIKYSRGSRKILIRISRGGGKAVIAVEDHGQGIKKEDQKAIFERYYQSANAGGRAAGFGLGLYICAEIIKKHGERIWVKSTPSKGSIFYFTLKLAK